MMKIRRLRSETCPGILALAVLAAVAPRARAAEPISANRIPKNQLIQPEPLHRELEAGRRPFILPVGSRMLFDKYAPPHGRTLLGILNGEVVGGGAWRQTSDTTGCEDQETSTRRRRRTSSVMVTC